MCKCCRIDVQQSSQQVSSSAAVHEECNNMPICGMVDKHRKQQKIQTKDIRHTSYVGIAASQHQDKHASVSRCDATCLLCATPLTSLTQWLLQCDNTTVSRFMIIQGRAKSMQQKHNHQAHFPINAMIAAPVYSAPKPATCSIQDQGNSSSANVGKIKSHKPL